MQWREAGRVNAGLILRYEGRYYLMVSGSTRTGENRTYEQIVVVGDHPAGLFTFHGTGDSVFAGDVRPQLAAPVYADGRWYAILRGRWEGQLGLGLATADDLWGPYTENPRNPLFSVETTARISPVLFQYDGHWVCLYAQ